MSHDPWITLAAARARVWLQDGAEAVLVGIPRERKGRKPNEHRTSSLGRRARVQWPDGTTRTVPLLSIVAVEQELPGVTASRTATSAATPNEGDVA